MERFPGQISSSFYALLPSRIINQDTSDGDRGGRKEVASAVPINRITITHEPKIGLMNQRRGL